MDLSWDRRIRSLLRVSLITFLLLVVIQLSASAWIDEDLGAENQSIEFLNDRSADIITSYPLSVPNFVTTKGLTGKGQIVGIADSGLDGGNLADFHPDLQGFVEEKRKVVQLHSWSDREVPDDPIGHGTHMAATVAGTGAASNGQYQGIAPEASLYFQALLDSKDQLQAPSDLKKLWQPAYSAGVRIHINAWGSSNNIYSQNTQQIDDFVHQNGDFLPIFAAGNNGPNRKSLTAEANSKNALVVGASQSARPTLSSETQDIQTAARFSSQGPTQDGRIKPDLISPGSGIVSATSQLTRSNYAPNTYYTVMSGTSMAAAVTGGAVALLREWFQTSSAGLSGHAKALQPSAALLKAALINGARLPQGGPNQAEGFGVIDLTNTVLALQEKFYHYQDVQSGIQAAETQEYRFRIDGKNNQPLKVTLTWTDPPGKVNAEQSLVNDLDLLVISPTGEQYWGNSAINGRDAVDKQNNVEQVVIIQPSPGEYRITVKAPATIHSANDGENNSAQAFALVYGRPVLQGTVDQISGSGQVRLTNGFQLDLAKSPAKQIVNGALQLNSADELEESSSSLDQKTLQGLKQSLPGSQLYQAAEKTVYLVSRIWEAAGIQLLPTTKGILFMEINTALREGGYYLDPNSQQGIQANDTKISEVESLPLGVDVKASLNPISQTLWQVVVGYEEKQGIVTKIDLASSQIWLDLEQQAYHFTPKTALNFMDEVVEGSAEDGAYGAGDNPNWGHVLPGMRVKLTLSSDSRQINYLSAQRELVLGRIQEIDLEHRQLRIEGRATLLWIADEVKLRRNQQIAQIEALQVGDYLTAVIMSSEDSPQIIIQGAAHSQVDFGRVLYYQAKQNKLALVNALNQIEIHSLTNSPLIKRRMASVDTTALEPGTWVRIFQEPDSEKIWRIDLAETLREEEKVFQQYQPAENQIRLRGGKSIKLSPETLITKKDFWIEGKDLVPGEKIRLVWLRTSGPEGEYLASLEAETDSTLVPPRLDVLAQKQDNVVRITGNTSAEQVYIYKSNGERMMLPVGGQGYFVWYVDLEADESLLQVVAISKKQSSMAVQLIDIPNLEFFGFTDLHNYWAAKEINSLSLRGGISGYADGTFKPENPVNRAELASLVVRLVDWPEQQKTSTAKAQTNTDLDEIPAWALRAAQAVQAQGLLNNYSDGSFRPLHLVTRSDLAELLYQLLQREKSLELPSVKGEDAVFVDLDHLESAKQAAIQTIIGLGIMPSQNEGYFEPQQQVTRGETAYAFYHLLEILKKNKVLSAS